MGIEAAFRKLDPYKILGPTKVVLFSIFLYTIAILVIIYKR